MTALTPCTARGLLLHVPDRRRPILAAGVTRMAVSPTTEAARKGAGFGVAPFAPAPMIQDGPTDRTPVGIHPSSYVSTNARAKAPRSARPRGTPV